MEEWETQLTHALLDWLPSNVEKVNKNNAAPCAGTQNSGDFCAVRVAEFSELLGYLTNAEFVEPYCKRQVNE